MLKRFEQVKMNLQKTWAFFCDFLKEIFFHKESFFILLFLFIAYSFSLFNRTISIDDLARNYYLGEGKAMIAGTRWMFWLFNRLLSTVYYSPFLDDFLSLSFLLLSALLISCIFYFLKKDKCRWKYIVFVVIYTTYPLINEIWEYTGAPMMVFAGIAFSSFGLLLFLVCEKELSFIDYIFFGALLTPAMASYEAGVFSYITLVFIILYLRYLYEIDKKWLLTGLKLALPLVIALSFRLVFGLLLMKMYHLEYLKNGDTGLKWNIIGFEACFKEITDVNRKMYLAAAANYLPIFEFVVSLGIYAVLSFSSLSQKKNNLFLTILLLLSMFLQSFMQGYHLPYRTAQTVQLFTAFALYLFLDVLQKKTLTKTILITILLFLGYRQSVCLYDLLALNNQRSENEAMLVNMIGYRLYSEFNLSKPVVFCGNYDLGDMIKNKVGKVTESNINSVINWSMVAYDSQNMMKELFSYYGYDIEVMDHPFEKMNLGDYNAIAKQNGMSALDIIELEDYILVFFG